MDVKPDIVFLLGAGASKEAGVPDTVEFVKKFKEHIASGNNSNDIKTVNKIIEILEEWKKSETGNSEQKIDVELLLESLTKLNKKKDEPLLQFYKNIEQNFILRDYSEKKPLIDELKDFIKKEAIISDSRKIKYLEPLLDFIREIKNIQPKEHLNIISLNYDTCIEQFCIEHRLNYSDGFTDRWNPKMFKSETVDICLYKLHGSVNWYRTERGDYVKIPIDISKFNENVSKIPLISGENAESLMLYPIQKLDYAEPVLEMLVSIKHILESDCKFLIVVGYSFRDEHIKNIILDAARKNKNMHLILISPDAYKIYFEKLKYYDNELKTVSPLNGRVICLPYKFEEVFKNIRNNYLEDLRRGLKYEKYLIEDELKIYRIGDSVNISHFPIPTQENTIDYFLKSFHFEKAEELFNKYNNNHFRADNDFKYLKLKINYFFKMAIYYKLAEQEEKSKDNLKKLSNLFSEVLINGINIELNTSGAEEKNDGFNDNDMICIHFSKQEVNGNTVQVSFILEIINDLINFYNDEIKKIENITFNEIISNLSLFEKYLAPLKSGCITFKEYKELKDRNNKVSKIQNKNINEIKMEIKKIETDIINNFINFKL